MSESKQDRCTRILVVDDDPITISLMQATLEDAGFQVRAATNGTEALRACDENPPDLCIVDAVMPEMNGFDLCRALRARPDTGPIPILMATGLEDDESIEMAYEAGATDFIFKPLQWLVLTQRIRYMLRASRAVVDLHRSQETLVQAKEAAEAANQAKSEFLAIMGHELRTPLNAIIGFSTMIRDGQMGPISEDYAQFADHITSSGEHLLAAVSDILDFARADMQGLDLQVQAMDIADAVMRCLGPLDEIARNGGIVIRTQVDRHMPPFQGDQKRMEQIFFKLLSNAIKFSPAGGQVDLTVGRNDDGGAVIRISDSGIGIPDDLIDAALAPFGQADSKLSRNFEGLGIGLPLAKRLIELHDGTLDIVSKPHHGTMVSVHFPPERFTGGTRDVSAAE